MGVTTTSTQRTLGALRRSLMIRSGAAAGTSFGYELFNEFLKDAQRELYEAIDWKHLTSENIQPLPIGERWFDLPDDCDLERIMSVSYRQLGTTRWHMPMVYGIPLSLRSVAISGFPTRYETRWNPSAPSGVVNPVQIELYPTLQRAGELRLEYVKRMLPFEADGDVASLPDGLIFLHALFNAKSHFKQPDAPAISAQFEMMLGKAKSNNRRNDVIARAPKSMVLPEDLSYLYPPGQ